MSPSSESRNSSMVGQAVEAPRFGAGEVRWGFRPQVLERLLAVRAIMLPRGHWALMSVVVQSPLFTEKQGQYLAFIYAYTRVLGKPPAEADIQRYFKVTPPTVHQMVLTLERIGLIRRTPGVARSIELLVEPESLPVLR
jgi:LexA DNA binding domain